MQSLLIIAVLYHLLVYFPYLNHPLYTISYSLLPYTPCLPPPPLPPSNHKGEFPPLLPLFFSISLYPFPPPPPPRAIKGVRGIHPSTTVIPSERDIILGIFCA